MERTRWQRLRTLFLRLGALAILLLAGVLLAAFALLQSQTFAGFVIDKAMPMVDGLLPGTIAVGGFSGGLGSRFELVDVAIADETGDVFIAVDRVALEWQVFDLLFQDISASRVELDNPVVTLKQRPDGSLNVVTAFVSPDGSCLLYTSPSPRDLSTSRMPSSA